MLGVHIIELQCIPWWEAAEAICEFGLPSWCELLFVILGKFVFDIANTYLASRSMNNKETVWNSIGIGFFQNALKSVHRVIIHI